MTNRNIRTYAANNWQSYSKTVSALSSNDQGKPLVKSDSKMYCFDDIIKAIYSSKDYSPDSVDAIFCDKKWIWLIEFKSGFQSRITITNYDQEKAKCNRIEPAEVCQAYWGVFGKLRKKEIEELKNSIQLKAAESYLALEKEIMPHCEEMEKGDTLKLGLVVVIDENPDSAQVDILTELAGEKAGGKRNTNSAASTIRNTLRRFQLRSNDQGQYYYYDRIEVYSSAEFCEQFKLLMS